RRQTHDAVDHSLVHFSPLLLTHRPRRAAPRMAWREMRDECRAAQHHRLSVMQNPVDRMVFAAMLDRLKCWHVLRHRHHLRARHLLHQRITFLMIAVRMTAEYDFDVGNLESQLLDGLFNCWDIPLVRSIDE